MNDFPNEKVKNVVEVGYSVESPECHVLTKGVFHVPFGQDIISSARLHIEKTHPDLRFDVHTSLWIENGKELEDSGCVCRITLDNGKMLKTNTSTPYEKLFDTRYIRILIQRLAQGWNEAERISPPKVYDFVEFYVLDGKAEKQEVENAKNAHEVQEAARRRQQALDELGIPPDLAYILPDLVTYLREVQNRRGWNLETSWLAASPPTNILKSLTTIASSYSQSSTTYPQSNPTDNIKDLVRRCLGAMYRLKKDAADANALRASK